MRSFRRTCVLLIMAMCITTAAPAKSTRRKPAVRPVQVYSLEGCDHCASLKRYLRRQGVRLEITKVDERYMSLFPTVFYSDDSYDHGTRIMSGRASLPRSLEIIETE